MRITLATSPHVRHPAVLQNDFQVASSSMLTFIPIGLLSLISSMRSSLQIEPSLYDLNRRIVDGTIPLGPSFYRSAATEICSSDPDIVGFMTENESYHHVLQICREIKEIKPDCVIVLGGPHASAVAAATLTSWPCIDYIVSGEGETSFADLIRSLMADGFNSAPGVWYRQPSGAPFFAGERPLIKELDTLPYPAYDLYEPDPEEEIFFEVGRGCPFQCTFCSTAPFWKRAYRVKSGARIIEELLYVLRLYGPRRMHFTHDLFTTSKTWVQEVCQVLIRAGAPIKWTCSSRTDTVDAELLKLMATAGCSAIYFGLESGSPRILAEIRKKIDVAHSFEILRSCLEAGIAANVGFIGGFPSEDEQSLSETFDAYARALEIGCAPVHFFQFTPFEDSSIAGTLGDRICTGHFLDLPLGPELGAANRKLVASDPVVFGAYHRPRRHSEEIKEELIDGLEEFPTLVSAALLPALWLAKSSGGMFALYRRWVEWISKFNDARNAASYRRCFGTPVLFADFLMDEMRLIHEFPPALLSVLQVIRLNHEIAGQEQPVIATTMANYRTGLPSEGWPKIELSTNLVLGDIVGKLEIPLDIESLLSTKPPDPLPEPEPGPMYLLWKRVAPGRVQLLKADAFTFHAVRQLQISSKKAGDIVQTWAMDHNASGREGDLFSLVDQLEEAARLGVVHCKSLGG
ncbi:MAG: radical SAM protein [Acidobacteriota bacterium]